MRKNLACGFLLTVVPIFYMLNFNQEQGCFNQEQHRNMVEVVTEQSTKASSMCWKITTVKNTALFLPTAELSLLFSSSSFHKYHFTTPGLSAHSQSETTYE